MGYGEDMVTNIPVVGDSGTQYATDVNEFLAEVRATLESKVPFSALQGDELDLQNVPVVDAEYVAFYDQSVAPSGSPVGRFESYQGNIYWVNVSGAVQITSGGALNFTATGGIGGDYGGANPASFRFVDASQRYEAYDDVSTSTWAVIRARGFDVAAGAVSSNMAQIRYGGAGTYTITLPASLPGVNNSVVSLSSAGQLSTGTVTNDIVLGGSTKVQHGSRTQKVSKYPDIIVTGNLAYALEILQVSSAPFSGRYDILPLVGQKLTSVKYTGTRTGAGTATLTVRKSTAAVTSTLGTVNSAATGALTLEVSGLTEVIADGSSYHFNLDLPGTDTIETLSFTFQQDA